MGRVSVSGACACVVVGLAAAFALAVWPLLQLLAK